MPAHARTNLIIRCLNTPAHCTTLDTLGWSALVAAARSSNLLGKLASRIDAAGIEVPPAAARHLTATLALNERQTRSVIWELHTLNRIVASLGVPVALLKGAAYVGSAHPATRGRLFGDIDILVPRESLGHLELQLMTAGWTSAKASSYDQRYYRKWMHELPPMTHVRRGTVLDIHHTILPLTARQRPDPARILDAATPLHHLPHLRVPSPAHLLIHSITHLLHEGELHNGLRDLYDVDELVRHGTNEDYWPTLEGESRRLGLLPVVALGLTLAHRLIGTPIPESMRLTEHGPLRHTLVTRLICALYERALVCGLDAAGNSSATLARQCIYVRSHWLRMPPHLLAAHLAYKATLHFRSPEPTTEPLR